jgi:antitoxin HigA-1
MSMHNPPHPGSVLKSTLIIDEDGNKIDSVTNVAEKLNSSRSNLNRVIKGDVAISLDMAQALEKNGNGSAEMWLGMQTAYNLWQARHIVAA